MRSTLTFILLLAGGALAQLAAGAHLAWGMILGSGVALGGELGEAWLQNVSAASVALGVILGGRLLDRERFRETLLGAVAALGTGVCLGWLWADSPLAVMVGLGGLGGLGSGAILAFGVVLVARGAQKLTGLALGLTLGAGLFGAEAVWGSASLLSLSHGASYVLGWVALIAPAAAAAGGGLLLLTRPGPTEALPGEPALERPAFLVLLALAFAASFSGLLALRATAALSLIGLPEDSFASGVLVGRSFVIGRTAGAVLGGLAHDLLRPRITSALAALALAASLAVLSGFTGQENPWEVLNGAVGLASGLALTAAPAAAVLLFGPGRFGSHFGSLYLGIALGTVMVLPLAGAVSAHPQALLIAAGAACLALVPASLLVKR